MARIVGGTAGDGQSLVWCSEGSKRFSVWYRNGSIIVIQVRRRESRVCQYYVTGNFTKFFILKVTDHIYRLHIVIVIVASPGENICRFSCEKSLNSYGLFGLSATSMIRAFRFTCRLRPGGRATATCGCSTGTWVVVRSPKPSPWRTGPSSPSRCSIGKAPKQITGYPVTRVRLTANR